MMVNREKLIQLYMSRFADIAEYTIEELKVMGINKLTMIATADIELD